MIFWTKFSQKVYLRSKTEKVNTTIEFCMFELVYEPNFSLHWQFWFYFDQICPETVFQVGNEKNALLHGSIVVTYYIKLFRTGADRHNVILMSLLLLFSETIKNFKGLKNIVDQQSWGFSSRQHSEAVVSS